MFLSHSVTIVVDQLKTNKNTFFPPKLLKGKLHCLSWPLLFCVFKIELKVLNLSFPLCHTDFIIIITIMICYDNVQLALDVTSESEAKMNTVDS